MWKKIVVMCITFIGVLSLVFISKNDMFFKLLIANDIKADIVGGNFTGRIHKAPSNIVIDESDPGNIGLQKGDKVYIGVNNPKNNTPLGWQLIHYVEEYPEYDMQITGSSAADIAAEKLSITLSEKGKSQNIWFSLSSASISETTALIPEKAYSTYISNAFESGYKLISFHESNPATIMKRFNKDYIEKGTTENIIKPANFGFLNTMITASGVSHANSKTIRYMAFQYLLMSTSDKATIPDMFTMRSTAAAGSYPGISGDYSYGLANQDLTFSSSYFHSYGIIDGMCDGIDGESGGDFNKSATEFIGSVRPALMLNLENTVFAVSSGTTGTDVKGNVSEIILSPDYTSIYEETKDHQDMKLRLEDTLLTNTTKLHKIQNAHGNEVTEIAKNGTVYLNATAQAGSSSNGVNTVSAIVFDSSNKFVFYKPLGAARGNGNYVFDTTGLDSGYYKIGIVNEQYDDSKTEPTYSSAITDVIDLEILPELQVTVTNTPQTITTYQYGENVKNGMQVASISTSATVNGIYYPNTGVSPVTYTVISDTSVSGHENDFKFFDISTDSYSNPIVVVKKSEGLDAGDYYFKVNGVDGDGNPVGGKDSNVVHIKVEQASASIAFDDPNVTRKSMNEATTAWYELATATPEDSNLNITYSISGGSVSLININSETGSVTYNEGSGFGTVKIKATVDDKDNKKDNYISAYAEKEIVILRDVDATVIPYEGSLDSTDPTFEVNAPNINVGGNIATVQGMLGTPDVLEGTETTYSYELKTGDHSAYFKIETSYHSELGINTALIKSNVKLGVGTYTFTVIVSDKWTSKEIPVVVNVGMAKAEELKFYENASSDTAIMTKSVSMTDTDVVVFASVKGSTNPNPVRYSIKDGSSNVISVHPTSGAVTIRGTGTVTIVAQKDGIAGQANAKAELTFTVTAGEQAFIYVNEAGKELDKSNNKYIPLTEAYETNKKIPLYTKGAPEHAEITFKLKSNDPALQDVISVNPTSGEVTILNATLPTQMGKIIVVATSHDPTGSYHDVSIELPINIEKGTRTVAFADDLVYVTSGKGSITPVIEVNGVVDTEHDALIEVDPDEDSSIAWTNDNQTIQYDYSGEQAKDIKLLITKPADRNYKIAYGEGTMHIMGPDENILMVTTPGKIVYGDHVTLRCTQDDSLSSNVVYTFTSDHNTYISAPKVTNNKAEFDAIQASGSTQIKITVTRTADGEIPLSKVVTIKVLPKDINIQINNQTKLKGEENPKLTYQDFTSQLVSWNGVQDVIQTNDIKLSTTATTSSIVKGYPITGDHVYLNQTYPNYSFTFTNGTLTITEETIEDDWYHLELDDGKNTPYKGTWTNQNVNIVSDHIEYKHISKDQSTWETLQSTVSTEGKTEQSFWLKKDTGGSPADSGAITSEKKETILIDKTAPTIKSITASDTNNKLQNIINHLTGGIFFKPGTAFEITTSDAKDDLDTSGTASIDYKIYKQNEDQTYGSTIKQDTLTVTNEKAKVTISDAVGTYKVCVLPKDHAGNASEEETCKELILKKIDVDIDGDGKDDFNDPDGDDCPDFNIVYEENGIQKVLNVDADRNGIPEMNIDSDGDGKPDINVDTDNDGKPDLNLLIMTKELWKPTKCVTQHGEQYASGIDLTPAINIDTTGNKVPNINIDTNGDMKPDINIDTTGNNKPDTNINTLETWIPNKDYTVQDFTYDTMSEIKPYLNIDTDQDGRPDLNIDIDGDGTADLNIDTNNDNIPDVDIDRTGDGKPDSNVDTNGDGKPDKNIVVITEWKPSKDVEHDGFNYDTMEIQGKDELEDNGIVVEKPDGSFLPNFAIKVNDVTESKKEEVEKDASSEISETQEVKAVYDVKLLENDVEVQPEGTLKVKIPIPDGITNPRLLVKKSNGTYETISAKEENGYLVYETSELGTVTVIGDKAETPPDPNPQPSGKDPEPTTSPNVEKPAPTKPTVQETITNIGDNTGGASTGDSTKLILYLGISFFSLGTMLYAMFRKQTRSKK